MFRPLLEIKSADELYVLYLYVVIVYRPLLEIKSADEFYCQMAALCSEMLQDHLIDGDDLIKVTRITLFLFTFSILQGHYQA